MWKLTLLILAAALAACSASAVPDSSPPPRHERPTPTTAAAAADTGWIDTMIADSGQISDELGSIADYANQGDLAGTTLGCQDGLDKIGGWQTDALNIPVDSIRTPTVQALADFQAAFQACASGDFAAATTQITAGSSLLDDATAAVTAEARRLGG